MFGASESAVALAERLLSLTPEATDHKVWLGHSGSDANDTAMRAIAAATGRRRFLCFHGAYHGGVSGSMSISNHPSQRHALPRAGLVQIPYADPYRPVSGDDAARAVFDYLDFLFARGCPPDDIGAVFIEPLQSDGGMIVPPPGFLRELAERCREHGILVVSDEVKVGLGRPGRWHCYQAEDFAPERRDLRQGPGERRSGLRHRGAARDHGFPGGFRARHHDRQRGLRVGRAGGARHDRTRRPDRQRRGPGPPAHGRGCGLSGTDTS